MTQSVLALGLAELLCLLTLPDCRDNAQQAWGSRPCDMYITYHMAMVHVLFGNLLRGIVMGDDARAVWQLVARNRHRATMHVLFGNLLRRTVP